MHHPGDAGIPFAVQVLDADLLPKVEFPGEVLEGNPAIASRVIWESADKRQARGIFESTPGQFSWHFAWEEFFVIVSGRATVETAAGEILELSPGTAGMFKAGDRTIWSIHETLRKGFHKDLGGSCQP